MRSLTSRAVAAVLALTLAGSASAACSGDAPSAEPRLPASAIPHVQVTGIPTVADSASLVYPVDAYLLTHDQSIEFDQATNLLEDRCMAQFGFDYTAPPPNILPGAVTDSNAPRRYGVSDAAQVARLGYHPPASALVPKKPDISAAGLMLLTGNAATDASPSATAPSRYADRPFPTGGCIGQARAQLTAKGGSANADPVAEQINDQSLALSEREPQVLAVVAQWSQCMARHGYHYATPYDASNDQQWNTPEPSAKELQTAGADVACKTQTNLVGTWYAVEAALQRQMIAANHEHLNQVRAGITAQLAAAGRILAATG
jgi:hypothetical protein